MTGGPPASSLPPPTSGSWLPEAGPHHPYAGDVGPPPASHSPGQPVRRLIPRPHAGTANFHCLAPTPDRPTVARVTPTQPLNHATSSAVHLSINGDRHVLDARSSNVPARRAARPSRLDRDEEGLRPRPVRRLHRPAGRPAGEQLPAAGGRRAGPGHHHHRGHRRSGRFPASDAVRIPGSGRLPVRLLHARPDLFGDRQCWTRPRAAGRAR